MEIKRIQTPEIPTQIQEGKQEISSPAQNSTDDVVPFQPDFSQKVMLGADGTQQPRQVKPALSEMVGLIPGNDSFTLNLKQNLNELVESADIDSAKSKIEPKPEALMQFKNAVTSAAAAIGSGPTFSLGGTMKTFIRDVKSTGEDRLPKVVNEKLDKLNDSLDTAEAAKAQEQANSQVFGTTAAIVVGAVAVVVGVFTVGPLALPAALIGLPTVLPGLAGLDPLGETAAVVNEVADSIQGVMDSIGIW
jgi:hypothetical protein